ncbi:hypothetical protein HDU98_002145, partial [Podochytrium sp. JEL0797]
IQFCNFLRKVGQIQSASLIGAIMVSTAPLDSVKSTTQSDQADAVAYSKLSPELQSIVKKHPLIFSPFENLPPKRPTDMDIRNPAADKNPPYSPIYPMSDDESKELKE